jgi:OFA family oxalate/formate antiporter-like MFS transporter
MADKEDVSLKKYGILIAAVVMQICLGATYSWSVYVQPLREITDHMQGTLQLPFMMFYFIGPATMVFSGALLPKLGPRFCAMWGGVFFGTGWLLAGLGDQNFVYTILGIGVLGGLGMGFAYIVPVATCIQWFPAHKGLVTGIAVAGFGGGAALVSQAADLLMGRLAMSPFQTFSLMGIAFLLLVCGAGFWMENPPGPAIRNSGRSTGKNVLFAPAFRILYASMFTALAAGFCVNANLRELFTGGNLQAGVNAVALFALANAAGRICWGLIFDRVKSAQAIQANLALQAIVLFLAPMILRSDSGLVLFAILVGFNYGGVLVVYAASTARIWGTRRVGQVYSWLFSANIPAAVAPMLAGYYFDRFHSFIPPLWFIAILMTAAAAWVGWQKHRLEGQTELHENKKRPLAASWNL